MIQKQPLPFKAGDLAPYMSAETIDYHYNHHYAGYVKTVNTDTNGTSNDNLTLKELINKLPSASSEFEAAVHQAYNHEQFWSILTAESNRGNPSSDILAQLATDFGGWSEFKTTVAKVAISTIGSNWLWVIYKDNKIQLDVTSNAATTSGYILFVIDLWEHAYYLDSPANKKKYISNMWNILNWTVINDRYYQRPA